MFFIYFQIICCWCTEMFLIFCTLIFYPSTVINLLITFNWASQVALVIENTSANVGDIRDVSLIPGLGRSPGEGHSKPLQYSCLENPTTEEPGRLKSIGLHSVGHDWSDWAHTITFNRFLVESSGFSICKIISLANRDGFFSYLPVLMSFLFLAWLLWQGLPVLCWIKVARKRLWINSLPGYCRGNLPVQ